MSKSPTGRRRFVFLRSGTLLVGVLLAGLAFAAYFLLGNVLNPPPYPVVIVVQEVPAGEALRQEMLSVDAQRVHPRVAGEYVLQSELETWLGATVSEPLHPGEPLTKARLVRAGNPAAVRHRAVGLEDPDRVAMVVPVNPDTCPDGLLPGDQVDLSCAFAPTALLGAGQETSFGAGQSGQPGAAAVGELFRLTEPPTLTLSSPAPVAAAAPPSIPAGATVLKPDEISQESGATLPLAKIVLQRVEVLAVHYEERPGSGYQQPDQGEGAASAIADGDIRSLEVAIPAGAVELLHLALENGSVRVALVSPNAGERGPTLGMTWHDLEAFFESQRRAVLRNVPPANGGANSGARIAGGLAAEGGSGLPPYPSPVSAGVTLSDTAAISATGPVTSTAIVIEAGGAEASGLAGSTLPHPVGEPAGQTVDVASAPAAEDAPDTTDDAGGPGPLLQVAGAPALPLACGGLALIAIPVAVLLILRRRRRGVTATPADVGADPLASAPPRQPSLDIQP